MTPCLLKLGNICGKSGVHDTDKGMPNVSRSMKLYSGVFEQSFEHFIYSSSRAQLLHHYYGRVSPMRQGPGKTT
jgi:hypothetical protein